MRGGNVLRNFRLCLHNRCGWHEKVGEGLLVWTRLCGLIATNILVKADVFGEVDFVVTWIEDLVGSSPVTEEDSFPSPRCKSTTKGDGPHVGFAAKHLKVGHSRCASVPY